MMPDFIKAFQAKIFNTKIFNTKIFNLKKLREKSSKLSQILQASGSLKTSFKPILILAQREIMDGMRNRWILMITILMAVFSLILMMVGSTPTGTTRVSPLVVSIVSLSSLSIFFIPLIALLLSYDAIVGERERGTLLLLLSYPVTRWQVVMGKFFGQLALLAVAIIGGFGVAGVVMVLRLEEGVSSAWGSYITLLFSSVLLGGVFLAIGLLMSVMVRERGTAVALAVGVWLLLVLIYDMGLLALLSLDGSQILGQEVVTFLLLANPTDAYRMINLVGNADVLALSGMMSLSASQSISLFWVYMLLLLWTVLPLYAACLFFERKSL